MPEENSRQTSKEFQYNSPTKQTIVTPIKAAFKSSKYKVGAFLEKIQELNRIKEKIKEVDLKAKKEDGKENKNPFNEL